MRLASVTGFPALDESDPWADGAYAMCGSWWNVGAKRMQVVMGALELVRRPSGAQHT